MSSPGTKNTLQLLAKSTVAAGLIGLLVWRVDWTDMWGEFSKASVPFLLVAALLYVFGIELCVHRWWRTAQFKGFSMSLRSAREHFYAGLFLNNFLPSFIGGDAYQSYILGKSEKRYAAAFSSVMFVRFTGLFVTIILFLLFGLIGYKDVFSQNLFAVFGISLFGFLLVDAFFFYARRHLHEAFDFLPEKIRNVFGEIGGYTDLRFFRDTLVVSAIFTIVGVGLFNMMIFWALGSPVPIIPYFSVVFLISIISSLPVSVNNIGLKEWAYYAFLPLIGIRPETALAVALLGRFLQILVSLMGASAFFREKREYDIG
ncbi:MAG: flippase-like domain-containing protein [Candidatus Moranbacteria bacterium]|nr:flippase-like domain-containing protein [Candidatus Moranbacteria bacterium]